MFCVLVVKEVYIILPYIHITSLTVHCFGWYTLETAQLCPWINLDNSDSEGLHCRHQKNWQCL